MSTTRGDPEAVAAVESGAPGGRVESGKIACNACPVLCRISEGRTGACDRYANVEGTLTRVDPLVLAAEVAREAGPLVPFAAGKEWDGNIVAGAPVFVTGVGAGTTYPDYKPAPFIVSQRHGGVETVTVVTEGIFSYCSFKIKIDTDRYIGPECAPVRSDGEVVGHVTTMEYGSQMLSLGGVHHLTGGSKKEGRVTCDLMMNLGNKKAVELAVEGGAALTIQAGKPPIIDGAPEQRMRVGCGSATIGIFAQQWFGKVDEVIVVDDHITGVLTEHQAGRFLGMRPGGINVTGRRSTPGRYFQVANPGSGWGGTDIKDPLKAILSIDPETAWPGERLLMVSTTGEDYAYFVLDRGLKPVPAEMPEDVRRVVERIGENCEPALATVLFMGGAGGSLRAGVTENPIALTRSIKRMLVNVTCGGAPAYVWPGGGIMVLVDVARMPDNSFGYVPTPAIVAPIEFTMRLADYGALGGHLDRVRPIEDVIAHARYRAIGWNPENPWPEKLSRGD
ncbi:MAG TPA: 6-hydroxynicotinate reductase [Alphaproteobacteria bacterium]|nr:6-hydroxynicotinate reductase [Alphaproteobacteria bacterium]